MKPSVRRRVLVVALLFLGACLVVGFGCGPVVRGKSAAVAATSHLTIGVEGVRPGFFSITLHNVSAAPEGRRASSAGSIPGRIRAPGSSAWRSLRRVSTGPTFCNGVASTPRRWAAPRRLGDVGCAARGILTMLRGEGIEALPSVRAVPSALLALDEDYPTHYRAVVFPIRSHYWGTP